VLIALGAMIFKLVDRLQQGAHIPTILQGRARPSRPISISSFSLISSSMPVASENSKPRFAPEGHLTKPLHRIRQGPDVSYSS
jgi:hypothetical protein